MLPSKVLPPDGIDDEVDAAAVGEAPYLARHVCIRVVDAVVHPVVVQPVESVVARRGREHRRAGRLRELDRREADASGARLHQHRLARLQMAELEQAVVGRAELDGDAGRLLEREAIGHPPRSTRRHADELGMRSVSHRRHDRVTDLEVGHAVADLAHDTRGLVADDVRRRREHAALAMQEIPALDADRRDLDQQTAGPHLGIGHVLVLEDLGSTDLVEARGLHDVAPFASDR